MINDYQVQQLVLLGGQGYVGSAVTRLLKSLDIKYTALSPFKTLNESSVEILDREKSLIVINCLGSVDKINENLQEFNVDSVSKILHLFREFRFHLIHMSSTKVEDNHDSSEYAKTKRRSEEIIGTFFSERPEAIRFLRLPSLWSRDQLQEKSLLAQLTSQSQHDLNGLIKNPEAQVKICSEKSFHSHLENIFYGPDVLQISSPEISWGGTVEALVKRLEEGSAPVDLQEIFNHWLLQKSISV